jgi:hypothetical protein
MDNNNSNSLGRRRVLQLLGAGGLVVGGVMALTGCNNKKSSSETPAKSTGGTGCNTPVDETSTALRKSLQYKNPAADPAKPCVQCAQYVKDQFGECGGCRLFTGPVNPKGGCLSFAPLGVDAGKTPG